MARAKAYMVPPVGKRPHIDSLPFPMTEKDIGVVVDGLNQNKKKGKRILDCLVQMLAKDLGIQMVGEIPSLTTMLEIVVLQSVSVPQIGDKTHLSGRISGLIVGKSGVGKGYFSIVSNILNKNLFCGLMRITEAGLLGESRKGTKSKPREKGALVEFKNGVIAIEDLHKQEPSIIKLYTKALQRIVNSGDCTVYTADGKREIQADVAIHLDMNRKSDVEGGNMAMDFNGISVDFLDRLSYIHEYSDLPQEVHYRLAKLMADRDFTSGDRESKTVSLRLDRMYATIIAVIKDQGVSPDLLNAKRFNILERALKEFPNDANRILNRSGRLAEPVARFAIASARLENRSVCIEQDVQYGIDRVVEKLRFLIELEKILVEKSAATSTTGGKADKKQQAKNLTTKFLAKKFNDEFAYGEIFQWMQDNFHDVTERTLHNALDELVSDGVIQTNDKKRRALKYSNPQQNIAHLATMADADVDIEDTEDSSESGKDDTENDTESFFSINDPFSADIKSFGLANEQLDSADILPEDYDVECIDNTGIEDHFDKGVIYLAHEISNDDSSDSEFIEVINKYGEMVRCSPDRFKPTDDFDDFQEYGAE